MAINWGEGNFSQWVFLIALRQSISYLVGAVISSYWFRKGIMCDNLSDAATALPGIVYTV